MTFPLDLYVSVADLDQEQAIRALLDHRTASLGIRPGRTEVKKHPQHDGGCFRQAPDLLRTPNNATYYSRLRKPLPHPREALPNLQKLLPHSRKLLPHSRKLASVSRNGLPHFRKVASVSRSGLFHLRELGSMSRSGLSHFRKVASMSRTDVPNSREIVSNFRKNPPHSRERDYKSPQDLLHPRRIACNSRNVAPHFLGLACPRIGGQENVRGSESLEAW